MRLKEKLRRMEERIRGLVGQEVVVIPKDGYVFLAEVEGIEGGKASLIGIGPPGEDGIEELMPLSQISDINLL